MMMNRSATLIAIALIALLATACSHSTDRTFKSSDAAFMAELEMALTQAGVPYKTDADGAIDYPSKDEKAFTAVRDQVDRDRHDGVLVRYDDDTSLDYLKTLLIQQGLKFRVEKRQDGEWVRWYPKDKAQETAMNLKVMQHQVDAECAKSTRCDKATGM